MSAKTYTPLQDIAFALFCNRVGSTLPKHEKQWRKNDLMHRADCIVRAWRKHPVQRDCLNRRQMRALRDGVALETFYVITPLLGGELIHHRMRWR